MNPAEPLWQLALIRLEPLVQKVLFKPFIEQLIPLDLDEQTIVLQAKDKMMCELIRNNYGRIIEDVLEDICGQPLGIRVVSFEPEAETPFRGAESELAEGHLRGGPDEAANPGMPGSEGTWVEPISGIASPLLRQMDQPAAPPLYNQMIPRYTFTRFVRGKSNELSLAAALAVADSPGRAYNPLFIYGDVGLGKTHLMHAIGHAMLERNPRARILYIPFEKFLNEFISAIRKDSTETFRNRHRDVDLLLVDDIQFIVSKEQTQDEFFHTFNSLYNAQKQIVISSDRPPREIQNLADRIRSRFEAGLMVDIQRPDLETRIAILQFKAKDERINVDPEVFSYIASRVTTNIRELEGVLMRLRAKALLDNQSTISLEYAASVLTPIIDPNGARAITMDLIQQIVASYYKVSIADLKAKKRTQDITMPRQIAMYFCRDLTDQSLPKIGEAFGGRDHTTVMHAVDKIEEMRKSDPQLNQQLTELARQIQV